MFTRDGSRTVGFLLALGICLLVFGQLPVGQLQAAERAKNVILLISDGAGFNAFEAASYYEYGELGKQPYDSFPAHFGCTTSIPRSLPVPKNLSPEILNAQVYSPEAMWADPSYCLGKGASFMSDSATAVTAYGSVTDSAAAATALNSGQKTKHGRIGMDASGCAPVKLLAEVADEQGKATGTISSVMASHATPGTVWAHQPNRNNYTAIFNAMVFYSGLDVIMGPGHPEYNDNGQRKSGENGKPVTLDYEYVGGRQTWKDLTDRDGTMGFSFVERREDFEALARGKAPSGGKLPQKVVGIPQVHKTLQAARDGRQMAPENPFNKNVPNLPTMTLAALNVLAQDPDGFFLMIEGGAVDWANHANKIGRMVEEQVDFNHTVAAVVDWVEKNSSWDETLVIVTSDHECGMLWGPDTYTDLNGNKHYDPGVDKFNGFHKVENRGAGKLPGVQYGSGGHTGALVPLWAKGPGCEQFATLVDGDDPKAGKFWSFSGEYVDNTDVFTVASKAMQGTPAVETVESAAP